MVPCCPHSKVQALQPSPRSSSQPNHGYLGVLISHCCPHTLCSISCPFSTRAPPTPVLLHLFFAVLRLPCFIHTSWQTPTRPSKLPVKLLLETLVLASLLLTQGRVALCACARTSGIEGHSGERPLAPETLKGNSPQLFWPSPGWSGLL